MEKLLVTGSAGFIGSKICEKAIEQGYEVYGLDIKETKNKEVKSVVGSITDKNSVNIAIKGVNYVIHTAAVTSVLEFEKDLYNSYNTNVFGFNNVIDAAFKNKVKKLLYASSSAVYLDSFSEEDIIDINQLRNHYSKSKLMNEMIAESYNDLGMETVGMRFFNVFGSNENAKGDYASIISRFIADNKERKPLFIYGDGNQARDFINVEDVANISLLLLKKADKGVYNVGTGKVTSYNQIADLINKNNKKYVKNPLKTYQYLTKADTRKLKSVIGDYNFKSIEEFINANI